MPKAKPHESLALLTPEGQEWAEGFRWIFGHWVQDLGSKP